MNAHDDRAVAGLSLGGLASADERADLEPETKDMPLRAIVDSLLDPLVLLEPIRDEAGKVTDFEYVDANQAACVYLKMDRDALIGNTLLTVRPGHNTTGMFDRYVATMETGVLLFWMTFLPQQTG